MSNNAPRTTTTTQLQLAPKNIFVAYILWFFLGQLGIHRFYLGKNGTGAIQLILGILGYVLLVFGVGIFLLIPLWIWLIIDIFLIPGMANTSGALMTSTTITTVTSTEPTPAPMVESSTPSDPTPPAE